MKNKFYLKTKMFKIVSGLLFVVVLVECGKCPHSINKRQAQTATTTADTAAAAAADPIYITGMNFFNLSGISSSKLN